MKQLNHNSRIQEATLLLLNCGEEIGLMKIAVDQIYEVFIKFSPVDLQNHNDNDIILPSGKAISPSTAAQCVLDFKRTTKFIRGIYEAIKQKLGEKEHPVQILYAGCGPFAAMITPLLTLYSKHEVCVDLLDINEVSLSSAHSVISGLHLNDSVEHFLLEDASLYKVEKNYDIIISETMQAGLKSEPQVAIMQNFFQQIKPEAIFIPEEIVIDAKLNTRGAWNEKLLRIENEERVYSGEVLKVSKHTINDVLKNNTLNLFNPTDEMMELKFYTTIKIFKKEFLTEGDSGLNSPLKMMELKKQMNIELDCIYSQTYPASILTSISVNNQIADIY